MMGERVGPGTPWGLPWRLHPSMAGSAAQRQRQQRRQVPGPLLGAGISYSWGLGLRSWKNGFFPGHTEFTSAS